MPAFLLKTDAGPDGFGGVLLPVALIQVVAPFAWGYAAWLATQVVPVSGVIPELVRAPGHFTLDTRQIVVGGCVGLAALGLVALVQMVRRRANFPSLYMAEVILALALTIFGGKLLAYLEQVNIWEILPHIPTLIADGIATLSMFYVSFSIRSSNTFSRDSGWRTPKAASAPPPA